jgi:hypothetical protein
VAAAVEAARRLRVVARAALLAPVAAAVRRLAAYVRGSQPRGYTPVPDDGTFITYPFLNYFKHA